MNEQALQEALEMARRCPVFVTTADRDGVPHLSCAGGIHGEGQATVRVREWFCPGTVSNVNRNPQVSLTVWDEDEDRGYQLIGRVTELDESGVLDGYTPEEHGGVPQVQRELVVQVEKLLDFRRAPHTDVEEE